MIKLTYKEINSEAFNQSLAVLTSKTGFSNFKASYNVAKIARKFESELKLAREMYSKWSKDYFVTAESEMPKIIDEKKEEYETKMKEFLATEITIEAPKLNPDDLGSIQLAPKQMLDLEPILDFSSFDQATSTPQT